MNLSTTQLQAIARGQRVRPNFNMFCNMGQELALQLKPIRSCAEVGKDLNMAPQAVHVVACVALGKIAWAFRELVEEEQTFLNGGALPNAATNASQPATHS